MKIIKYIIFSIIVFLLCFSFVTAKENVLEDVVIKEISGEVTAGSFTFDDDIINPTITFKEVNDSVIYELFINYNQELYEIDKIMDDNENEFIKTSYSIIGNKVFMMVKYENAVEKEFILDSIKIQIKLKEVSKDDNSSIINPETGIKTIFPILLILLISVGTIRMIKKKNVFILLFLLIPVLVYAKEDTILEIGLSTENIKIAYTVEFYSGDGVTGSIDDIECIYGEECTLPVNTMEKENNTFKGWSLEPGGEILYLDEAQVLDLISSGKVTLYPVWARLYTIEFNGNGSTSGSMTNLICEEGEECVLSENEFVKTNYTFAGWANSSDGEILYTNQEELIDLNDNLALYAKWVITITNFDYTGASQTYTVPVNGQYKMEVWGAQGGQGGSGAGGNGGYSTGIISLSKNTALYVYVGGQGASDLSAISGRYPGGFNGGGTSYGGNGGRGAGGGATDIRIGRDSLYARVIVAGAGGGGWYFNNSGAHVGAYGGGREGKSSFETSSSGGGGTQISGGLGFEQLPTSLNWEAASFGKGGGALDNSTNNTVCGGGGGWYGGASGNSSGGGSGWIYTAESYEYWSTNSTEGQSGNWLLDDSYYLKDAETLAGNVSFTSPTGTSETGHSGNGYARITYLGN